MYPSVLKNRLGLLVVILMAGLLNAQAQNTRSVRMDNGDMLDLTYDHDSPDVVSPLRITLFPYGHGNNQDARFLGLMANGAYDVNKKLTLQAEARFPYSTTSGTPNKGIDPSKDVSLFEYSFMGHYRLLSFSPERTMETRVYRIDNNGMQGEYIGNFYLPYHTLHTINADAGISYMRTPGVRDRATDSTSYYLSEVDFVNLNVGASYGWGFNFKVNGAKTKNLKISREIKRKLRVKAFINLSYGIVTMVDGYLLNTRTGDYESLQDNPYDINKIGFRLGGKVNYYLTSSLRFSTMFEVGRSPGINSDQDDFARKLLGYDRIFVGIGYDFLPAR